MNYEINKGTLAIVPNDKEDSLVYEDNDRYIINENFIFPQKKRKIPLFFNKFLLVILIE